MVFLLSIGNNGRQKKVVKRAEETAEDVYQRGMKRWKRYYWLLC